MDGGTKSTGRLPILVDDPLASPTLLKTHPELYAVGSSYSLTRPQAKAVCLGRSGPRIDLVV
jgi:hypothetical protein